MLFTLFSLLHSPMLRPLPRPGTGTFSAAAELEPPSFEEALAAFLSVAAVNPNDHHPPGHRPPEQRIGPRPTAPKPFTRA